MKTQITLFLIGSLFLMGCNDQERKLDRKETRSAINKLQRIIKITENRHKQNKNLSQNLKKKSISLLVLQGRYIKNKAELDFNIQKTLDLTASLKQLLLQDADNSESLRDEYKEIVQQIEDIEEKLNATTLSDLEEENSNNEEPSVEDETIEIDTETESLTEEVSNEEEPVQEELLVEEEPVQEELLVEEEVSSEEEPVQEELLVEEEVSSEEEPVQEELLVEEEVSNEEEPVQEEPLVEEEVSSEEEPVQEEPTNSL